MMSPKTVFILAYVAFGMFCLASADLRSRMTSLFRHNPLPILLVAVASFLLLGLAMVGSHLFLAAAAAGTAVFAARHGAWATPGQLVLAASSITVVMTLAWWTFVPIDAAPLTVAAFAGLLAVVQAGLSASGKRLDDRVVAGAFAAAGILLLADLGAYQPGTHALWWLAHHWGAYVGSAEHLRAGLVPFHDVPIQYGLGPTFLLAAACGLAGCWTGTEVAVVAFDVAAGTMILKMALAGVRGGGWAAQCAAAAVVFAAVFLWTGDPAYGSTVLATPSVGGLRYLPVTLVAFLLFSGRPAAAAWAMVPAVLWAPESAAMSLVVYGLSETARIGLARACLRSAACLVGSHAALVLAHRAAYGVWVDPLVFAEYLLNVPGVQPLGLFGNTWLVAATLALGGWLLAHPVPDPAAALRDRVAVFLAFATIARWLGESHVANVCAMAPFLALVGFRVLERPRSPPARLASTALAASVAALAMSPWVTVPFDPRAQFGILPVVAGFPSLETDVERIRARIGNPGHLGIADFGDTLSREPSETVLWTPMDPSSLWRSVPAARRRLYIRRAAERLRRSGWAIVEADQGYLFDDLSAAYDVSRRWEVTGDAGGGGVARHYTVACFDFRPDGRGPMAGPRCPEEPDGPGEK